MASAKIYGMDGTEKGTAELNAAIFDVPLNEGLVHEVAVALLSARRHGNAETKTRKQVSGGGAKPYRQKGTGSARHGSTREPQMRGGGTVFGPHKRCYRKRVPVAMKRKALCCVLSDRARNGNICVLDQLVCETPKTKPFAEMVGKLSPAGKKVLFVTADTNKNAWLSCRNIPKVSLRNVQDLNVVDVLDAAQIVLVQDALPRLETRLGMGNSQ